MNFLFEAALLGIALWGETSGTYYDVCTSYAGLNREFRSCLYAAPHPQVSSARDTIYSGELRSTLEQWCSVTSPWQRSCFKRVTSHCSNADALADVADKTGLCDGLRPSPWITDIVQLFTGVDRTCPTLLPDTRPEFASTAPSIEHFKRQQQENFERYLVRVWFSAMSVNCHNHIELFFYRFIMDLLHADLGVNYVDEHTSSFTEYWL